MGIEASINSDIKAAMLAREQEKLEALRAVKAAILLEKTKKGGNTELDDSTILPVLQRLVKQRKESAAIYKEQNRADLADAELFQASVIGKYLPAQLGDGEILAGIRQIIADTGAEGMKDMGRVMGQARKKFAGRADNRKRAEMGKKLLTA